MAAFLLHYAAMEENKAQRKQAEDKSIFFWFGDDLAVDDNPHRAGGIRRKCSMPCGTIEGSRKEVANGFVQNARTYPSRSIPARIGETASGNTNPKDIFIAIISHPKIGNGSAAGDSNGRRVGSVGGKSLRSSASRNSLLNGLDVYGVGAGKEGREGDCLVVGRIGVENVSVGTPRVGNREIAGGSDARVCSCGGGSAKNPEGLVGGVVLAGIDMDVKLGLGFLLQRNQSKHGGDQNR